jgi:hypothetical protein
MLLKLLDCFVTNPTCECWPLLNYLAVLFLSEYEEGRFTEPLKRNIGVRFLWRDGRTRPKWCQIAINNQEWLIVFQQDTFCDPYPFRVSCPDSAERVEECVGY